MTRVIYEVIELRKNGVTIPNVVSIIDGLIIHKDGSPATVDLEWTTKDGTVTKVSGWNYQGFPDNTVVISVGDDRYTLVLQVKA